jgi:hypothetical protein
VPTASSITTRPIVVLSHQAATFQKSTFSEEIKNEGRSGRREARSRSNSGHWLMEEQLAAAVAAVSAFLDE